MTLTGDLVLTGDQAKLALVKELKAVIDWIVAALEAENALPKAEKVKEVRAMKNPFA